MLAELVHGEDQGDIAAAARRTGVRGRSPDRAEEEALVLAEGQHEEAEARKSQAPGARHRQARAQGREVAHVQDLPLNAYTHINLADVEDAAPANGFGDRWEARVARQAWRPSRRESPTSA